MKNVIRMLLLGWWAIPGTWLLVYPLGLLITNHKEASKIARFVTAVMLRGMDAGEAVLDEG